MTEYDVWLCGTHRTGLYSMRIPPSDVSYLCQVNGCASPVEYVCRIVVIE